jgi:hypothetical protein
VHDVHRSGPVWTRASSQPVKRRANTSPSAGRPTDERLRADPRRYKGALRHARRLQSCDTARRASAHMATGAGAVLFSKSGRITTAIQVS